MNLKTQEVEQLLAEVAKLHIHHEWGSLSEDDDSLFRFALVSRILLEVDLLELSSWKESNFRRILLNQKDIEICSYFQCMKRLKLCYIAYCNVKLHEGPVTWHDFKHHVKGIQLNHWMVPTLRPYVEEFGLAIQWLSYDERLNFRSLDYKTQILSDYIAQEVELENFTFDEQIVSELNLILGNHLKDFSLWNYPCVPTSGPGAVAGHTGRLSFYDKYLECEVDARLLQSCKDAFALQEGIDMFPSRSKVSSDLSWRTCDLVVVPKNALTGRTISKEPIGLQWVQQAIKTPLYDYINKSKLISADLSDQDRSRKLCLAGSVQGEWATVDFSAASDWISWRLVDRAFENTPLHDIVLESRSLFCNLDEGMCIPLNKFAPMGSAMCFPIMTLIIDGMCRYTVGATAKPGIDYIVYGDDVVIRQRYAEQFMSNCQAIGLRPNWDKSYYSRMVRGGQYREACGIECFAGVDITPLRLSRRLRTPIRRSSYRTNGKPSAEIWMGFIDLMNRAFDYRYVTLRSFLNVLFRTNDPSTYYSLIRINESEWNKGGFPLPAIKVYDNTATNWKISSEYNKDIYSIVYYPIGISGTKSAASRSIEHNFKSSDESLDIENSSYELEVYLQSSQRRYDLSSMGDIETRYSTKIDDLVVDPMSISSLLKTVRPVLSKVKYFG